MTTDNRLKVPLASGQWEEIFLNSENERERERQTQTHKIMFIGIRRIRIGFFFVLFCFVLFPYILSDK